MTANVSRTSDVEKAIMALHRKDFTPVVGATEITLYVMRKEKPRPRSRKLLSDAGLRAPSAQEIIPLLMKDEVLLNAVKGMWFPLSGNADDLHGDMTVNDKEELVRTQRYVLPEKLIDTWPGNGPPLLSVHSDDGTAKRGSRFTLTSNGTKPDWDIQAVVGMRITPQEE